MVIAHVSHTRFARSACRCPRLARGYRDRSERTIVLSRDATRDVARAPSDRSRFTRARGCVRVCVHARVSVIDSPAAGVSRRFTYGVSRDTQPQAERGSSRTSGLRIAPVIVAPWSWVTGFTPRSGSRRRGRSGLVSRAVASRWRHQAESVRAPLPPLYLSLLPPRASRPSFFSSLSLADSRLRAAAASFATGLRDVGHYAPTGTDLPCYLAYNAAHVARRSSNPRVHGAAPSIAADPPVFAIGEIIDSLPLMKPRFRAPSPLRHRRREEQWRVPFETFAAISNGKSRRM